MQFFKMQKKTCRPPNPVEYLATFLLKNNPNKSLKQENGNLGENNQEEDN